MNVSVEKFRISTVSLMLFLGYMISSAFTLFINLMKENKMCGSATDVHVIASMRLKGC